MKGSSLDTIAESTNGVIYISLNRDSVLSGKSGRNTPDELTVELKENLRTRFISRC